MNLLLKKTVALLIFCFLVFGLFAQKPIIDSSVFGKWPSVGGAVISSNGEYVSYTINSTLIIQDMYSGWKTTYESAQDFHFSGDNQKAFFQKENTLYILTLGKEKPDTVIAINSIKSPRSESGEWLAYEPKDNKGNLVLLNLLNGKETQFNSVIEYVWEDQGKVLLLTIKDRDSSILKWVDLPSLKTTKIWSNNDSVEIDSVMNAVFDNEGEQLSFETSKRSDELQLPIVWYYRRGTDHVIKLVDNKSKGLMADLSIVGSTTFSRNGRWIFFQLQKQVIKKSNSTINAAQVDVYSYKDYVLQSQQLASINAKPSYLAVISVSGGTANRLQQEIDGEDQVFTSPDQVTGDYIVLGEKLHDNFKPWWLTARSPFTYFLVSLRDGSRKTLRKETVFPVYNFSFSPDGNLLIYWDSKQRGYLSYDIQTTKTINITHAIPNVGRDRDYVNMFANSMYVQPIDDVRWTDGGRTLLVYSLYDIWKVDPSAKRLPVNLSNGYGARHHISLRLVYETAHVNDDQALVTGFNERDKKNGFFRMSINHSRDPELLTMGPYSYYRTYSQLPSPRLSFSHEQCPVQAKKAKAWIISRETASEHPNYFYTHDWKKFTALTNLQPQKYYNWITSELVTWRQLDGAMSQGILYKPENFDPRKKYPVIFNYYEHLSYRLYEFPDPGYTAHNINIPWFVSRGYLVFTPDNHYTRASNKGGKTVGEAVYNSVVSAAKYLSTLPYVDSKHLGLQGHSFGGGETNYLVTHSKLFAAACSAAGTVSDQFSAYLGPYRPKGGHPIFYRMAHSEDGHDMIGATLWERPDLYFRSSSIFNANQVTTPLLLMHNEKDNQTDWGQSFELYAALTRLGKPVWLLQYDNGAHSLRKTEDMKDFTIRLTQFFDHYLKGTPPPLWMTRGIPASEKGIDQGYELDLSGKKP